MALALGFLFALANSADGSATGTDDATVQPDPGEPIPVTLAPESSLWLEGTSTVRDYLCRAGAVDAAVRVDEEGVPFSIEGLQKAVSTVVVTVPVAELDCDNDTMNDHMWKALKRDANPEIRFELDGYVVQPNPSGTALVDLGGRLTIAGVTHTMTITTDALVLPDGSLRVVGSSEFPMTRFGVKPPRLMLGVLKVHDPVTVHFDLILQAPASGG